MGCKIIAFVGAGGKTTLIHRLSESFRNQGLKVFITTTTHMMRESDTLVDPVADSVAEQLAETGLCMAGSAVKGTEKIGPLSAPAYRAGCAGSDIVLVEADGSRHHLLKYPESYEPVIPDNTDTIVIVMGIDAIGKSVSETVHRFELACERLDIRPEDTVTEEMIVMLAREGYAKKLRSRYPGAEIEIVFARQGANGREYELYERY